MKKIMREREEEEEEEEDKYIDHFHSLKEEIIYWPRTKTAL